MLSAAHNELLTRASAIAFTAMMTAVPFLALVLTLAALLLPDQTGGGTGIGGAGVADRGLAGEHDAIGLLVDRVGDVGDLGAGRDRLADHRLEHVRGDDHRPTDG